MNDIKYVINIAKTRFLKERNPQLTPIHRQERIGHPSCENPDEALLKKKQNILGPALICTLVVVTNSLCCNFFASSKSFRKLYVPLQFECAYRFLRIRYRSDKWCPFKYALPLLSITIFCLLDSSLCSIFLSLVSHFANSISQIYTEFAH